MTPGASSSPRRPATTRPGTSGWPAWPPPPTRTRSPRATRPRFGAWLERRRARLAELLGPEPEPVPLNVETLESVRLRRLPAGQDRLRHRGHHVGAGLPARARRPRRRRARRGRPGLPRPRAGQVARWSGWSTPTCPTPTTRLQLARRGYVVLAPDLRCFGERLDWNPEDHYACDTNLVHAAMAGWNPLAQNIWDLRRCLDVLEQHPLVDPARIGMVGISYGGTVTLFTAAVDDRVAASVVSGYFSSWAESHKMPWNMCGSQIMFGMLGRLEHEDLGALVAPRPHAGRVRAPRTCLFPVGRGHRVGAPHPARLRAATVPASAWCTTSSRAGTSGTAPRPCPSWTAGSATAGSRQRPGDAECAARRSAQRRRAASASRRRRPAAAPGRARPGVRPVGTPWSPRPGTARRSRSAWPSLVPPASPAARRRLGGPSDGPRRTARRLVTGAMQPARRRIPPAPPAAHPARHYRKPRRTSANADARTTVPCTSWSVGTETGWAVGTFMRERTAETGVPGPR